MTIFCQDLNSCHIRMQSVPKLDLFSKPGCLLDSDCEFDKFSSMAMSVGINDSDSTSIVSSNKNNNSNNKTAPSRSMMGKRQGKRPGRKPTKIDERAKLERSRQSAKECRARKKLRYQYLEELVSNREKAVVTLRDELEMFRQWCLQMDQGQLPEALVKMIANEEMASQKRKEQERKRAAELQRQDMPSTSSASVFLQSSSSSSSSSSPSPPQVAGNVPYSLLRQFQEKPKPTTTSSTNNPSGYNFPPPPPTQQIPPPPSYTSSISSNSPSLSLTSTSSLSTPTSSSSNRQGLLTRQMAFDDGTGIQHHHNQQPLPQYHSKHHQLQQQHPHKSFQQEQNQRNIVQFNTGASISNLPQQSKINSQSVQGQTSNQYSSRPNQQINQLSYQGQSTRFQQSSQNQTKELQFSQAHRTIPAPPTTSPIPDIDLDDISDLISREGSIDHSLLSLSNTRVRSQSNPLAMASTLPRSNPIQRNEVTMTTPRRTASFSFSQTGNNQLTNITHASNQDGEHGIFTGFSLPQSTAWPTLSDPESDSADDSPSQVSRLFQSSLSSSGASSLSSSRIIQKRTLSEPEISHPDLAPKKSRSVDMEIQSMPTTFTYLDNNLNDNNTANCMASTRTLNTPLGFLPRNTDSPMTTSSDIASPTPSCQSQSTSPSPASYPHFLDYSIPSTSSTNSNIQNMNMITNMEADDNFLSAMAAEVSSPLPPLTPTTESFIIRLIQQEQQHSNAPSNTNFCSETGLSATISEQIPDVYSYLADLQSDSVAVESNVNNQPTINYGINPNQYHQQQRQHQQIHQQHRFMPQQQFNVPITVEEISSEESA